MKIPRFHQNRAFTLAEMMVAVGLTSVLMLAILSASVSLQKSFAAVDNYFATHMQQVRIIDYLARDVKRSFSVTTSADLKTVTCIMPNYVVQSGEAEALANSATIGTRRTPALNGPPNKQLVDYGTTTRTVTDAAVISGSTALISAKANFTTDDVTKPITGSRLQTGTTISAVVNSTTVTLSKTASSTGTNMVTTIYGEGMRAVFDAVTTSGSATLTSATAAFTSADVGKAVVGTALQALTTIQSVANSTTVTLSKNASATSAAMTMTIGGTVVVYTVSGSTITRTENGILTMIASSTDQLLPQTTDWQASNTEYTTSTVTFMPIFTSNNLPMSQTGTTVYSTAFLRNKRRGN